MPCGASLGNSYPLAALGEFALSEQTAGRKFNQQSNPGSREGESLESIEPDKSFEWGPATVLMNSCGQNRSPTGCCRRKRLARRPRKLRNTRHCIDPLSDIHVACKILGGVLAARRPRQPGHASQTLARLSRALLQKYSQRILLVTAIQGWEFTLAPKMLHTRPVTRNH